MGYHHGIFLRLYASFQRSLYYDISELEFVWRTKILYLGISEGRRFFEFSVPRNSSLVKPCWKSHSLPMRCRSGSGFPSERIRATSCSAMWPHRTAPMLPSSGGLGGAVSASAWRCQRSGIFSAPLLPFSREKKHGNNKIPLVFKTRCLGCSRRRLKALPSHALVEQLLCLIYRTAGEEENRTAAPLPAARPPMPPRALPSRPSAAQAPPRPRARPHAAAAAPNSSHLPPASAAPTQGRARQGVSGGSRSRWEPSGGAYREQRAGAGLFRVRVRAVRGHRVHARRGGVPFCRDPAAPSSHGCSHVHPAASSPAGASRGKPPFAATKVPSCRHIIRCRLV